MKPVTLEVWGDSRPEQIIGRRLVLGTWVETLALIKLGCKWELSSECICTIERDHWQNIVTRDHIYVLARLLRR